MPERFVYLASSSPRRRELLTQIDVAFVVLGVAVDESADAAETPSAYVTRVAAQKARAGWRHRPTGRPAPVLAADTAVVLDHEILGKPRDAQDARRMLLRLSGRTHAVLTAVAVANEQGVVARLSSSEVTFRSISVAEADAYWATGEPRDKAGGYAIQGAAAVFIENLHGSYSGVMGLPLFETAQLLTELGMPRWRVAGAP
ncbi:MAG: Maf family protein [Steroidobacteraceae bacterium]